MRANQDRIDKNSPGHYTAVFYSSIGSRQQKRFRSQIQALAWIHTMRLADGQHSVKPIGRGLYGGYFWADETRVIIKNGFKTYAEAETWVLAQQVDPIAKIDVDNFAVYFSPPNVPPVLEKGFKTRADAEAWLLAWRKADGQAFLDGWRVDEATGRRFRDADQV